MIVGYQANGTKGRALVDGKPTVRIHGKEYPVKASVHTVGGLSAHADVHDLTRWMGNFRTNPQVHVVHGEPEAKQAFRDRLDAELRLKADVPGPGDILEL